MAVVLLSASVTIFAATVAAAVVTTALPALHDNAEDGVGAGAAIVHARAACLPVLLAELHVAQNLLGGAHNLLCEVADVDVALAGFVDLEVAVVRGKEVCNHFVVDFHK